MTWKLSSLKEHPFIIVVLTIISMFGGAVLFVDNIIKFRDTFFPHPVELSENYWFVELNESNRYSLSADDHLAALQEYTLARMGQQLQSHRLIKNDVLSSAFSSRTYNNIQLQFCNESLSNKSITQSDLQSCLDQSEMQSPSLAIYAITNSSTRLAKDIIIRYKVLARKRHALNMYDKFIDEATLENSCLMYRAENEGRKCLLRDTGKTESYKIDNLSPGETVFLPIYVWSAANFHSEPDHQIESYDGYISGESFIFPEMVHESGKLSIRRARPMSKTPTIMLGEYETRG